MTRLHAFVNDLTQHDQWNTPGYLPCGECGVQFKNHGSFGSFDPPDLDEVVCDDPQCPANLADHTLADHS